MSTSSGYVCANGLDDGQAVGRPSAYGQTSGDSQNEVISTDVNTG